MAAAIDSVTETDVIAVSIVRCIGQTIYLFTIFLGCKEGEPKSAYDCFGGTTVKRTFPSRFKLKANFAVSHVFFRRSDVMYYCIKI